ncbi:MAG: hypothetical protein V4858_13260 [Pseudomonadota bacterium]
MEFQELFKRLLAPRTVPAPQTSVQQRPRYEEATGYYTVRGEDFDKAFSEWHQTKALPQEQASALTTQACVANLDSRSGYVREFCLRVLAVHDWADALKPVVQRLNDYVPVNRELALQLTLKWLAELPVATVVEALPELAAIAEQSRANHAAVHAAVEGRLDAEDGRNALVAGLMHNHAKVRRECWKRCFQKFAWTGPERIEAAMRCGDPAIARSVEQDVYALPDDALITWFEKIHQVRAMPLRRAFLVALRRKGLVDASRVIACAIWDDSFSIRWLGRHWSKDAPEQLLQQYLDTLDGQCTARRKRYAFEGLALLKLPGGLQVCKNALLDQNPVIRKAALQAICAMDAESQSLHVANALQDADLSVVRMAFRQVVGLGLPLPLDAIEAVANLRRDDLPFFVLMLEYAANMSLWPALHLASFTTLAAPSLKPQLQPCVGYFLDGLALSEVYVAPTKQQWQAICTWLPIDTLAPNSSLRYVMEIYAKRINVA